MLALVFLSFNLSSIIYFFAIWGIFLNLSVTHFSQVKNVGKRKIKQNFVTWIKLLGTYKIPDYFLCNIASRVCSVAQSCLIPCKPMDCSLPGYSVHGIFQARILEWVAISYSRESSRSRDPNCISCISCINKQILYYWTSAPRGNPI